MTNLNYLYPTPVPETDQTKGLPSSGTSKWMLPIKAAAGGTTHQVQAVINSAATVTAFAGLVAGASAAISGQSAMSGNASLILGASAAIVALSVVAANASLILGVSASIDAVSAVSATPDPDLPRSVTGQRNIGHRRGTLNVFRGRRRR